MRRDGGGAIPNKTGIERERGSLVERETYNVQCVLFTFVELYNHRPPTKKPHRQRRSSAASTPPLPLLPLPLPLRGDLVVDDGDVARNELCTINEHTKEPESGEGERLTVLQNAPIRQIDPAPLIRDDDDRPAEGDVPAEPHVAGDGEMVELEDDGHGAEALLEVADLLERVAELDHGRLVEHPVRVHDELAVLQAVEV
jgi:hypothetical protein